MKRRGLPITKAIGIDSEVYDLIRENTRKLEAMNTALRRMLGLPERPARRGRPKKPKAPKQETEVLTEKTT